MTLHYRTQGKENDNESGIYKYWTSKNIITEWDIIVKEICMDYYLQHRGFGGGYPAIIEIRTDKDEFLGQGSSK